MKEIYHHRGNALFLILIAVALFAALSYAVTQSGRGGGTIEKEQADIKAAQFISFMGAVNTGIQRMVLSGTAADDIVFYNEPLAWTSVNTPCTTGEDCLWAPEGGGVTWPGLPSASFFTPIDFPGENSNKYYFFSPDDGVFVDGVGTAAGSEMLIAVFGLPETICAAINRKLGLAAPASIPNNSNFDPLTPSSGAFDSLTGEMTACGRDSMAGEGVFGGPHYIFRHVLIAQ